MVTVNIHEAKAQISKLVDQAVKGEAFVIAKAGKPLVKVTALDAPPMPQRLGFLAGEIDGVDPLAARAATLLEGSEEVHSLLESALQSSQRHCCGRVPWRR